MGDVVSLARHKKNRARESRPKPSKPIEPDEIIIRLQPDGSGAVIITGAYAHAHSIAIKHLADVIKQLISTH